MGRPKKQPQEKKQLTTAERKYIDLSLKTTNDVNYDLLFAKLAAELSLEESVIRDYANRVNTDVSSEQLPPEPEPKQLTPTQERLRNIMTPNRLTEKNKARHVTVMTDVAGEAIKDAPSIPAKGSSRMKDVIFRQ